MTIKSASTPTKLTADLINPEAEKLKSYPLFDWLRFGLASLVVLGHANFEFIPGLNGRLAVEVFFALSGWLIGGILLKTNVDELPRFFYNRATRIWVPYAIALLFLYGFAVFHEGISFFWLKYLILDTTFTHQIYRIFPASLYEMPLGGSGTQFWSIAVEEQFYLIAPIIMIFISAGRTLNLWLLFAFFLIIINSNFAAISLGVCAAILQRDFDIVNRKLIRVAAISATIICAIGIVTFNTKFVFSPILAVSLVVACAITGARTAIGITMGGLSYPLYLNHWIGVYGVNFISKRWLPVDEPTFVITQYLANVLIALALYWAIDREIQKRRNAWFSPQLGRTLTKTAYGLVALGLIAGGAMHIFGPHGQAPSVVS